MPTPQVAAGAVPTPRRAKQVAPSADGAAGADSHPAVSAGPIVTADGVEFRLADPRHDFDGVRLEVDWIRGDIDQEFGWAAGCWTLRIPRPDAWRLEYQLTLRRGGDTAWTPDPGNPLRVPNPFGDKSEIRFPDYREPGWLHIEPAGPVRTIDTPKGRLDRSVPVRLWTPPGLPAATVAPLLLVNDGSDMAERGSLLSWATNIARDLPIRVALLDPPNGLRDEWYAANPDYSDHIADIVLPALTSRVLTGPIIGMGASLGALAMLALQRSHPASISALALQSGSFFTRALDPQEGRFGHFEQICAAVQLACAGPDLAAAGTPRPVPVLITYGSIEENQFNNTALAAALRQQQHPVTIRIVPDAHTMIGWRDAWFPALDELIRPLR